MVDIIHSTLQIELEEPNVNKIQIFINS